MTGTGKSSCGLPICYHGVKPASEHHTTVVFHGFSGTCHLVLLWAVFLSSVQVKMDSNLWHWPDLKSADKGDLAQLLPAFNLSFQALLFQAGTRLQLPVG